VAEGLQVAVSMPIDWHNSARLASSRGAWAMLMLK
jgi:hypothetical protein